MLLRVLLIEQVSDATLHCVWKFPNATDDEVLLLERIDFLWREGLPRPAQVLRATQWQSIQFGKDFVVVVESSGEPGPELFALVSKLAYEYQKSKSSRSLAQIFIEAKLSSEYFGADLGQKDGDVSLVQLLKSLPDTGDAAKLWAFAMHGRVRLCEGNSAELLGLGKILAGSASSELYPLMLKANGAELAHLSSYGCFICCCPTADDDTSDPTARSGFWDLTFHVASKRIVVRELAYSSIDVDSIGVTLESAIDDAEFKKLTMGKQMLYDDFDIL
jgi:hypothetical protein